MADLAGKKILLVDDDRDILAAMETTLSGMGATVLTASDGDEALIRAEEGSPDLVVLDMMLPKRSGFLVMERLRRGKNKSDPPRVITITANTGHRHKAYAQSLGVDDYLNKPFPMDRLVTAVEKVLGV